MLFHLSLLYYKFSASIKQKLKSHEPKRSRRVYLGKLHAFIVPEADHDLVVEAGPADAARAPVLAELDGQWLALLVARVQDLVGERLVLLHEVGARVLSVAQQ